MADRKRDKPRRKSSTTPSRRAARSASTHERRRSPLPQPSPPEPEPELDVSPTDHYAREKARRADRRAATDPLEEARLAFQKLLAKEAEAQRGGRPKGSRTRGGAKAATDEAEDE